MFVAPGTINFYFFCACESCRHYGSFVGHVGANERSYRLSPSLTKRKQRVKKIRQPTRSNSCSGQELCRARRSLWEQNGRGARTLQGADSKHSGVSAQTKMDGVRGHCRVRTVKPALLLHNLGGNCTQKSARSFSRSRGNILHRRSRSFVADVYVNVPGRRRGAAMLALAQVAASAKRVARGRSLVCCSSNCVTALTAYRFAQTRPIMRWHASMAPRWWQDYPASRMAVVRGEMWGV